MRFWTMRFEAKHQYFKALATRMGNYINVTYSLALRQQSYQCYVLSTDAGFCSNQQKIGKGTYVHRIPNSLINMHACIGKSIKVHATEFKEQLLNCSLSEDNAIFRLGIDLYNTRFITYNT